MRELLLLCRLQVRVLTLPGVEYVLGKDCRLRLVEGDAEVVFDKQKNAQ